MNNLMFSMMMAFVPVAPLPTVEQVKAEIGEFSALYSIKLQDRVVVKEINVANPSPFLTLASNKSCTIHINSNPDAQKVWSYLVDAPNTTPNMFTTFAIGHELFHCIAALPNERARMRGLFQKQLNQKFSTKGHFEEVAGDALGLSYAGDIYPHARLQLTSRVVKVRKNFAQKDSNHDSSANLKSNALMINEIMIAP